MIQQGPLRLLFSFLGPKTPSVIREVQIKTFNEIAPYSCQNVYHQKVYRNSTEKKLEVTSRERREEGQDRERGVRGTKYAPFMYKINQMQGYIVTHRENSQNAIITLNEIQSTTIIESVCCMPKTNIMLQINYTLI